MQTRWQQLVKELTGVTIFAAALSQVAYADEDYDRPTLDVDGQWMFMLDPNSIGEEKEWFNPSVSFSDVIEVPGAWDVQGFGQETDKLRRNFVGGT